MTRMSIASILGPDGTIAQQLSNYEPRPQQLAMADAVTQAIAGKHHLMVEAGTGVGKSFAYLVPAILAACADKECRVVVSTHTISLQEQLLLKDIPFLKKVMPQDFNAVLVKGRGNYLSLRRLHKAQQRMASLLAEDSAQRQLNQIGRWSRQSHDGSRSDLSFQPLPAVWDLVESDTSNCLGRNCQDYDQCFYFKARRRIYGAQVLVVNHALFFSDLALRLEGASLLPDYRVVIFDEAHTLEDVAADHLGLHLSRGAFDYLFNKLYYQRGSHAHGLLVVHGTQQALELVLAAREAADRFFHDLSDWLTAHQPSSGRGRFPVAGSGSVRVRQPEIIANPLSAEMETLADCLSTLAQTRHSDEDKLDLTAACSRCLKPVRQPEAMAQSGSSRPGLLDRVHGRTNAAPHPGQRCHRGGRHPQKSPPRSRADGRHDQCHPECGRKQWLPPFPAAPRLVRVCHAGAGQSFRLSSPGSAAPVPYPARSFLGPVAV